MRHAIKINQFIATRQDQAGKQPSVENRAGRWIFVDPKAVQAWAGAIFSIYECRDIARVPAEREQYTHEMLQERRFEQYIARLIDRPARARRHLFQSLCPEDVKKRMVEEADRYAEQDRKRREEADQLNTADAACYEAERTLNEFGPKLSDDLRRRIEQAIRDTREPLSKRDAPAAMQRAEALRKVLQEAGAALYAQSAQATAPPPPGQGAKPQERVVEAEFHETR